MKSLHLIVQNKNNLLANFNKWKNTQTIFFQEILS